MTSSTDELGLMVEIWRPTVEKPRAYRRNILTGRSEVGGGWGKPGSGREVVAVVVIPVWTKEDSEGREQKKSIPNAHKKDLLYFLSLRRRRLLAWLFTLGAAVDTRNLRLSRKQGAFTRAVTGGWVG
jgi:hypothetical protein